MKTKYLFPKALFCCVFLLLAGCKKNENTGTPPVMESNFKLNIVYFLPSDQPALPDYEKRLSDILLYIQNFYKVQMDRNGFGTRTFALQTDVTGKKVKLTVVHGLHPRSAYPYKGGGDPIQKEVEAYFKQHLSEKTSDHYLVITPVPDIKHADVPFYGVGNWAFVLDHDNFDIIKNGVGMDWLAGTAHELGHGLGLPHDKEKVSEHATVGSSIMSSASFKDGAMLSKAACAILNNCQVVNSVIRTDYYQPVKTYAKSLNISYAGGKMIISGRFFADKEINGINIYQDPDASNDAYDAPSWSVAPIDKDSFYVETPIKELWTPTGSYTLYIQVLAVNGIRQTVGTYHYSFNSSQVPVIDDAIGTKPEIEKKNWSILDVDSQQDGYPATNVLDKDPTTYWHTQYSPNEPTHPHQLTIDMHQIHTLNGLTFTDRQNVWPGIKDLQVFVKSESGDWISAGVFTLRKSDLNQFITFSTPRQARYFRIVTTSSYDDGRSSSLAEIGAY